MTHPTDCDDDIDGLLELRTFGRKRGRKLSPHQDALLTKLLPQVSLDLDTPAQNLGDIKPHGFSDLWLEIGFGGGEHFVWQALHNPQALLIGCEPFVEGAVKVLAAVDSNKMPNVRVHTDDARPLLRWLPPASLSRCFILFPDPWPKKRHVKRRLVSEPTLALLARAMRPGAELRLATDIADYARTMLIALQATPQFQWQANSAPDWRRRPDDWPQTRYEAKAIAAGRKRYYLSFKRT